MKLYNMIGYKLFKILDDESIDMVRIVGMRKPFKVKDADSNPSEITIYEYSTGQRKKVKVVDYKDYTPLEPDGILTASIVSVRDSKNKPVKDVIVSATKYLNIKLGISSIPYAVCRQNITDIFYNLMAKSEDDTMAGLAVNMDTCPSNFDFRMMFAADSISFNEFINFYRTDTMEDILSLLKIDKYDEVLKDTYERHCNHINRPDLLFKSEHAGWCKSLKKLIEINNFESDINQMLGITKLDFALDDYIDCKCLPSDPQTTYNVAGNELRYWLSLTYKVNMSEVAMIEFDHDINMADFNNSKYLILRDSTNKMYLAVYTTEGEFFEDDLKAKAKEYDFSTKFKIDFYNKYNKINN